jgi:hypothetical protein
VILVPTLMLVGGLIVPAALIGGPDVEVIEISFDKDCKHDVNNAKTATAKKKDRDVVVWSIVSECKDARELTIRPVRINPFVGCVGDPRNFKIGSRFRIDGAAAGKVKAYAVCTVDWVKSGVHKFKIDMPHTTPGSVGPLDHELALEVVP